MSRAIIIFVALTCALAMSQFLRAALSVVAPDMMADTGISAEQYGTLAGALFLGIAASQIPAGMMLDRFGPRLTIAGLQTIAALGTAAFALVDGVVPLFAARVVIGFGLGATLMGGLVVAARWFPPDRFAQVGAYFLSVAGAIGLMLAATPMAALSDAAGWRVSFLIAAAVTLCSAGLVLAVVRDAPDGHAWHRRAPESLADILRGYRTILRLKGLPYVMMMAMVGYPTMITLIGVWGGPYLADVHGLDGVARGNVLSALIVGGMVGLFIYGPLDRWVDSRKYVVLGGNVLAASILALLAVLHQPPVALVTGLFGLYGVVGSYYMTNITLGRGMYPDNMVGRGVTTVNFCTFCGLTVVQFLIALLMGAFGAALPPAGGGAAALPEAAYRTLFGALAAYALVIAAFYTRVRDIRPSDERARAEAEAARPARSASDE